MKQSPIKINNLANLRKNRNGGTNNQQVSNSKNTKEEDRKATELEILKETEKTEEPAKIESLNSTSKNLAFNLTQQQEPSPDRPYEDKQPNEEEASPDPYSYPEEEEEEEEEEKSPEQMRPIFGMSIS